MNGQNPSKEQFRQMLMRYLENQASDVEKEFIEQWYEAYGQDFKLNLNPIQRQQIEDRLWKSIESKRSAVNIPTKKNDTSYRSRIGWLSGLAASLLIILTFSLYYSSNEVSIIKTETPVALNVESSSLTNTGSVAKVVSLADGTVIRLEPNSSLRVSNIMDNLKREVYLEGEAFFEVAHDSLRPFYVYTGTITTKVLGTSFTIGAREELIFVAVKTGKVSVTQTTQKSTSPRHTLTEEIILTPNQKAVYNGKQITMAIVDKPQRILEEIAEPLMEFDEQPVVTILAALEDAYGIDIVYDTELIKSCILTTTLSDEDLYDRLNIICKAIKGTYEVEGSQIKIVSNGCN